MYQETNQGKRDLAEYQAVFATSKFAKQYTFTIQLFYLSLFISSIVLAFHYPLVVATSYAIWFSVRRASHSLTHLLVEGRKEIRSIFILLAMVVGFVIGTTYLPIATSIAFLVKTPQIIALCNGLCVSIVAGYAMQWLARLASVLVYGLKHHLINSDKINPRSPGVYDDIAAASRVYLGRKDALIRADAKGEYFFQPMSHQIIMSVIKKQKPTTCLFLPGPLLWGTLCGQERRYHRALKLQIRTAGYGAFLCVDVHQVFLTTPDAGVGKLRYLSSINLVSFYCRSGDNSNEIVVSFQTSGGSEDARKLAANEREIQAALDRGDLEKHLAIHQRICVYERTFNYQSQYNGALASLPSEYRAQITYGDCQRIGFTRVKVREVIYSKDEGSGYDVFFHALGHYGKPPLHHHADDLVQAVTAPRDALRSVAYARQ